MDAIKMARELSQFPVSLTIQWKRVGYKQAWTSNLLRDRYYLIKSYQTIVGIVDTAEQILYEIGKYSPTTSKQITQIHRSMFSDCGRQFVEGRV